jgi:hypothetical protein
LQTQVVAAQLPLMQSEPCAQGDPAGSLVQKPAAQAPLAQSTALPVQGKPGAILQVAPAAALAQSWPTSHSTPYVPQLQMPGDPPAQSGPRPLQCPAPGRHWQTS